MYDIDIAIKKENGDVLNRGNFAEKLAKSIIDYSEPYPLTIGLTGSWGSGKTSIFDCRYYPRFIIHKIPC